MPSKELLGSAKVTAFSFMRRRREKGIAGKGMENKYEESLLGPYSKISLDGGTRTEIGCSFDSAKRQILHGMCFRMEQSSTSMISTRSYRRYYGGRSAMDRERPFRVRQRAVVRSTDSGNSYKLAHLIGAGEVPLLRWRCFAERLDRAGQIGQGFGNGNQLASFTLHDLFSHVSQTRQGHRATIPGTSSLESETPAGS